MQDLTEYTITDYCDRCGQTWRHSNMIDDDCPRCHDWEDVEWEDGLEKVLIK